MSDPNVPPSWGQQPPPPQGSPPPPQQPWGEQPPDPNAGPPPQQQWGQPPPPPQFDGQSPAPGQQAHPQPGYPQQGYSPQPGQGSSGLEPNVGAMLSYLLFGWIGGLIMYFTQKHPEVRFHAAQSIILFGGITVVQFGLGFVFNGLFGLLLSGLISLASFGLWIFMSIQGYQLSHTKLPVIGDIAEQWAAKPA